MKTKIYCILSFIFCFVSGSILADGPDYLTQCQKTIWENLNLPAMDLSIGGPGFLGNRPVYNAEIAQEMAKLGVFLWRQNFNFVTDNKDILALDALEKDPIMYKNFYIPVDETFLKILKSQAEKNANLSVAEIYPSLKNRKILWFLEDKQYEVPIERLKDLFDLDRLPFQFAREIEVIDPIKQAYEVTLKNLDIIRVRPGVPSFWSTPVLRGILEFSDFDSSGSIKKVRKKLKALYETGHRVVFNKHQEEALKMLTNQERRGTPVSLNLFQNEEVKNEYRERFAKDRAFTVEFESPEGKLLGGTIGYLTNGLLFGESVFYDKTIDYVKFAVLGLVDLAKKHGITFIDLQMVTPFSKTVKGKYISREKFYSLWKKAPNIDTFDFPDEWIP